MKPPPKYILIESRETGAQCVVPGTITWREVDRLMGTKWVVVEPCRGVVK